MRKNTKKQEDEKKSWETLYKAEYSTETKGQYNLFRLYAKMGVTRSIGKLQEYCEKHKAELQEENVSFPHPPCNILPMERQVSLG